MKKASISLFALVAIVFAVASAFTTSKTITQGWYLISTADEGLTPSDPAAQLLENYSARATNQPPSSVNECGANNSIVCAAYFQEDEDFDPTQGPNTNGFIYGGLAE